jgi:hypothetical protein
MSFFGIKTKVRISILSLSIHYKHLPPFALLFSVPEDGEEEQNLQPLCISEDEKDLHDGWSIRIFGWTSKTSRVFARLELSMISLYSPIPHQTER